MRWVDPTLQLAACGSSHRNMPTYGAWEYEVLEHCFDQVDFISLHTYFRNDADDIDEYFGVIELMDAFIKEVVAICRRGRRQAPLAQAHHAVVRRMERLVQGAHPSRTCASPAGRRRRG